ncbi:MAG: FlgD immunoglobulin-like domain containing protein [Candidatus Eisenbacteria bacterium]
MMWRFHLAVGFTLVLSSAGEAVRYPPKVYPLLFQTMPGRFEPSDFPKLARYDVIELNPWATDVENGNLDSLRAIRSRKPDLVTLLNLSASITCSNWGSNEFYNREAWAESVAAHADMWLLRDVDGDLYLLKDLDTLCAEGRLNYYSQDMARAFARFIAEGTVLRFPNDVDGIRIDDLNENIHYMNKWTWLHMPGVDSIDVNQDGIADTYQDLGAWWSAGVDTFLATLRNIIGPEVILTVNGYIPIEAYQWVNGRFHEGYPHEHGDGWEVGMTHWKKGFLGGDTLYSDTPVHLSGLPTFNASTGYNFDPDHLSTKEAPYPHIGFSSFLRFSLASNLLGEGYYGMTGWGTSVDWKGDPIPYLYQTLWWFPVYDTLKTYLGTPVGKAVHDTGDYGRDRWWREFTGGRTRVFPYFRKGILDLGPLPSFEEEIPEVIYAGAEFPVPVSAFDPNGPAEPLQMELRLSRDGGITFPEVVGTGTGGDTVFSWTSSGPAESCVFRLAAVDTSDLAGTAFSSPFRIEAPPAAGGLAEIRPDAWVANMPSVLCTLSVWTPEGDVQAAGWDRIVVVLPETIHLLSFGGAELDGVPLAATAEAVEDTVRIDLSEPVSPPARVSARFFFNAPAPTEGDSLRIEVAVGESDGAAPLVSLEPGDANGIPGDGNTLSITCAFGPPARIAVEPEETTLAAGDTTRFALSGYDEAGNVLEVTPVWSASDTLGSIDGGGLFRAVRPGSLIVTGSVADLEAVARVTILPGAPDSLRVIPDDTCVTADDSVSYVGLVYDALGNLVPEAIVGWSLEDTLGAIDASGRLVPKRPGTTTVLASSGGVVGRSALRVEAGEPCSVRVEPRSPWTTVGDTVRFGAEILDRWKNEIDRIPAWTVTESLGVIDSTGLFLATGLGNGRAVARAGDAADSVALLVAPAPAIAFLIDPREPVVTADSTVSFVLLGVSALADTFPVTAAWAVRGEAGTIDEEGIFSPRGVGAAVVVGSSASGSDSTSVTVFAGAPVALLLDPDSASIEAGETLSVRAVLLDRNGDTTLGAPGLYAEGPCEGPLDSLFACERTGTGRIVGVHGDLRDTLVVRVRAARASRVAIDPDSAAAVVGTTISFSAVVTDPFGNAVDSAVVWEAAAEIGTIDGAGLFTAETAGTGLVAARSGLLADTAAVEVTAPPEPPEPPARTLVVRAAVESYEASRWPAPITLYGATVDEAGNPIEPEETDSFVVSLLPLEETIAACGGAVVFPLPDGLIDSFSVPITGLGGCGLLAVRLDGPAGIASALDTIRFSSPDVNGDLRADLEDAAVLLEGAGPIGGFSCADLDADGFVGAADLAILAGAYDQGCGAPAPPESAGVDPPSWQALGDALAACDAETIAACFRLDPGALDSIRALEVSFPARGKWDRPIVWIPSSAWDAPLLLDLPDGPDGPRVLIVETGGAAVLPGADGLVEVRVCGASTDDFGGGTSYARVLKGNGETTVAFETPIRFLLDIEDEVEEEEGGEKEEEGEITDTTGGATPLSYALLPNLPNPFRGSTTIRFTVPSPGGALRLGVFNVRGECVRVLEEGTAAAGTHALLWDGRCARGRTLPPGIYFVRLDAPPATAVKKILLLP